MKQVNCGSCEYRGCTRQCLQKGNGTSKLNHNLCNRFLCKGETSLTELIILSLIKGKMIAGLNNLYCCTYWTKKKISHLRTSYDFAHLADLVPVVQKMDNPIQSINLYPVDSAIDNLILIYWIVIYLLDSANQGLYNRRQYFIAYIIWLLDIACLFAYSKRSFLLYFFPI